MSKFWKWAKDEVSTNNSELILDGVIASDSWWEDDVTPKQFRDELSRHTGNITVRINSPGGDVFAGVAIYNALREHDGEVTVKVDGLAASIASLIAMAGDKIIMLPGSMMMVHQPWTIAWGNSDELAQVVEMLEKTCESMVPIYVARTGLSEDRINELLKAETWMTADEAVELGFATEAVEAKTTTSASIKNALSFASSIQNAVMQPAMSMKARAPIAKETAAPKETAPTNVVTTEEEETTDPTPPETKPVNKSKEISDMNKKPEDAAAVDAIVAAPPKQEDTQTGNASSYLSSMQSVKDFTQVLFDNAGKNPSDVRSAWHGQMVKNGITNPDILELPEPLVTEIKDAVKASTIYSKLNHTGLDGLKLLWDSTDPDADTSRAGQHNPDYAPGGNPDKTKDQQVLTFEDRELEADYIYKYLVLDKKTIRKNRGSGALMRFVMNELPTRIVREMERAAIIGDGRASNHKRKITSFISVKSDVAAGNSFASEYVPQAGDSLYESVAKAKDELLAEGTIVLIAKKGFSTRARFEKDNDGRLLFPVGTRAQDIFEVEDIIEPQWFTDANDADYDAYLVVLSAYKTVGDNSIESFTNFKLETNENEFLQEIYKGGGLSELKAAVGITATVES